MEPATTITILAIAMTLALGLAICFGVRMMKLQNKLNIVKNCLEASSLEDSQPSSHTQHEGQETVLSFLDPKMRTQTADDDYDVLIYNRHDGTVEFYKEVNE